MNTEITLPVSELKSVLPGLNKVISRRATLPVLGCVRIERNQQNDVTIAATDLDDFVNVQMKEPAPGQPTVLLVQWDALSKAIKNSASKDNIVLVDNGKKGVTLRTFIGNNPVDQKLEFIEPTEWPSVPVVKDSGIMVDSGLRQALREAFECASQEESRLILNSAYLDVSDSKAHYVVSTNGRSLFSANSFTFDLKKSLIVPHRNFLDWAGAWEDETCWLSYEPGKEHGKSKVKDSGWVQLKTARWTFITKEIEGNYPNWKQVIPSSPAKTVIKLSQAALDELLSVIPKLPGKDDINSPVTLVAANSHLQIQARHKFDEKPTVIPIDGVLITGENVSIGMNREHLVRALQFGLGEILVQDSLTPITCQSEGKRMVIATLNPGASIPPNPPHVPTSTTTPPQTDNERTEMTKTTAATTTTEQTNALATDSAIKQVIQQVEKIKDALKEVLGEFSDLLTSLKTAEKEKRATDKEIEQIRATLKQIQNVKI